MKTTKIIILITLLIFLVACTGTPEKTLQYNFKQGYGALAVITIVDSPPKIVYPNSEYKMIVKLENQGAYDLTNGEVKILGFDEKYILLEENEKEIISLDDEPILSGRSSVNPDGASARLEFEFQTRDIFPGAESYTAYYFIKADYDYKTELIQTVCINPKTYEIYDSGCKVEPKISLGGQGSPLAVAILEEIISPGSIPRVEFRFTLKNKGKGEVGQVRLNQARLSDKSLDCEFRNNLNADKRTFDFREDREAILICKRTLEDQKSYETPLFLDFSFDYSVKEKKKITLQR
jgi:hypothetical protein